jgi:hypothetical protein
MPTDQKLTGTITFIQNHLPALDVGEYVIETRETLTVDGTLQATYSDKREFAVRGERFRLNPTQIYSVFPPDQTLGDFSATLPHLVFNSKTLPWQFSTGPGDTDTLNDKAPWQALFLFDEEDPVPPIKTLTLQQLQQSAGGTFFPDFILEYGEQDTDQCQVIDVPLSLFNALAPSMDDLRLLGHARRVNMKFKASDNDQPDQALNTLGQTSGQGNATHTVNIDNDFAVIIGNRLPRKNKKSTVFLVSLENFGAYLPDSAYKAAAFPAGTTHVRLVTFRQWSFTCADEQESFTDYFDRLNQATDKGSQALLLQLPGLEKINNPAVKAAFSMGYTALDHDTRHGDHVVSWYKGPLVPYRVAQFLSVPLNSADAGLRYNADNGMFDVSYAAAWQLGRLLALQNKHFSLELFNWKQTHKRKTASLLEQQVLHQRLRVSSQMVETGNIATSLTAAQAAVNNINAGTTVAPPPPDNAPANLHPRNARSFTLSTEAIQDLHDNDFTVVQEISSWMARLRLLYGVPYHYLIPDEQMLPPESLKFFYLDPNWIEALMDGAFSIGRLTAGDLAHDSATHPSVRQEAVAGTRAVRSADNDTNGEMETITGFILHSRVISAWPGMEINAFTSRAPDASPVPFLRLERLSENILFCLIEGEVVKVNFHKPPEGLHFGFYEENGIYEKNIRGLSTGAELNGKKVPATLRDRQVIKVAQLAGDIKQLLGSNSNFTTAEFAMEMVEGVDLYSFQLNP